jgi:hypothetical protein
MGKAFDGREIRFKPVPGSKAVTEARNQDFKSS